jgi:hypothetical protein
VSNGYRKVSVGNYVGGSGGGGRRIVCKFGELWNLLFSLPLFTLLLVNVLMLLFLLLAGGG